MGVTAAAGARVGGFAYNLNLIRLQAVLLILGEIDNTALKGLKQQLTQIERKRQKLWDLYIMADDESYASITPNELDEMLRGLNEEKKETETEFKSHEGADDNYYVSLNLLLELVQNAGRLFRSADTPAKAQNPEISLLEPGTDGRKARLCLAQTV